MVRELGKRGAAERFNIDLLEKNLDKCLFGKEIIFRDTIGSTNVFLKHLAQKGAPEGTVVIADDQSAGLGRLGRQWYSKACENLLFSVLLRPKIPSHKLFELTMIFALAGIDAVKELTGIDAMIKWPNDIYAGQKKIGGILSEVAVLKGVVEQAVLGMGLNVNWKPSRGQRVLYPTSSLLGESGTRVSREGLLVNLLKQLDASYQQVTGNKKRTEEFYRRWNEKSLIRGKRVVIETGKERIEGMAAGIDDDGALTLIVSGGRKRKFVCGDVSVKLEL
jgi:BirA family biotin operon repressor/biotin-[acetyl-CoA-carboxylase] ligase